MEEINMILEEARDSMRKSIQHLEKSLLKVRAGRATPSMLDDLKVDYYGSPTPVNQVANVNTPDARTISVQPWEKTMIPEIEKAIINSDLGLNPQNNGEMIILNIPPLTEERRKELVKKARSEAEDARIGVRSARKDANTMIKDLKDSGVSEDAMTNAESEVQDLTNGFIKKIDDILEKKESEIMTV